MPGNLLRPFVSSKTRRILLVRFFLNPNQSSYLQVLSKELDKNTRNFRVELNCLEEAGLLSVEEHGRRKEFSVDTASPLTTDLSSILRKVTGMNQSVHRVVGRLLSLEQV